MVTQSASPVQQTSQIYFCDHPTALSFIDRSDIPPEKFAVIRTLHRCERIRNLRLLVFFGLWAGLGYLAVRTDFLLVQLVCYFGCGWIIVGLTVLMHEGVHGLLLKKPALNRWLGFVCSAPALVSFSAYRTIHLLHHKYEHTDQDPDDAEVVAHKFSMPLVAFYYLYAVIGAYVYVFHINIDGFKLANWKNRRSIAAEITIIAAFAGLLFWFLPLEMVLKIWVFPWLVAAHITSFRGVPEHGLTTGGNAFTATRTVVSNKFVRFMLCNANYHLEHHLFPGMPWYNLPKVHQLLQPEYQRAGASVYASYTKFYIDFFRSSLVGIKPNIRLIPHRLRRHIGC
ncbi:MAG: hypothetical protein ALAOOOJD_01888 [bacterium]|nr:hypothetical protein [bacterium]